MRCYQTRHVDKEFKYALFAGGLLQPGDVLIEQLIGPVSTRATNKPLLCEDITITERAFKGLLLIESFSYSSWEVLTYLFVEEDSIVRHPVVWTIDTHGCSTESTVEQKLVLEICLLGKRLKERKIQHTLLIIEIWYCVIIA